jgi:polyferredoxin
MWLTYIAGGYWYVVFYGGEKAIIKQGPWPFSHSFYMEMKEHIFLMLLLLSTYLPIVAWNDIVNQLPSRKLLLWTSAIVIVLSLVMEGAGAIISMGVKVSLLASQ